MDYKSVAEKIVAASGGMANISDVTHCATRLRFVLVDDDASDQAAIEKIDGVLGIINAAGQQQVVLGGNVIGVYKEAVAMFEAAKDGKSSADAAAPAKGKKALTPKGVLDAVIGYVASAVTPLVPGLIGGGMLKVILLLIGYAWPAFLETGTYTVLGWVANAPFYFMPIFVAWGAAVKLGATPIYAMAGAASMLTPEFMTLVADKGSIDLLGIELELIKY